LQEGFEETLGHEVTQEQVMAYPHNDSKTLLTRIIKGLFPNVSLRRGIDGMYPFLC